jgi:hypothetical protein
MLKISKLTFAAALAAVTVAAPALAQSFNPRDGTGNELPLQYRADGGRNDWTVTQPNAQVAARKSGGSSQIAARPSSNSIKIAGHRAAHHGAA